MTRDLQKILDKKFGPGRIAIASEARALVYDRVPTGSLQLDLALGGGLPLGRITEFAGPESHGKTTAILRILAENQKLGRVCAFVDTEGSFDFDFARKIGVDLDALIFNAPASLEDMIDMVEVLVASREVSLIAIDSITGPVPTHVQGRSADEPTMGTEAKLNNLFCRKVVTAMAPGDLTKEENRPWCSVIYTNQLRDSFDMYGGPDVGGGWGLRFFKSISVLFRRAKWLDAVGGEVKETKAEKWGATLTFVAKKNKTAVPHGTGEVDFFFRDAAYVHAGQYDLLKDVLITATRFGLIEQRGAYYYVGGANFLGMEKLLQGLRTDLSVSEDLRRLMQTQHGVRFWYYFPSVERRMRRLADATEVVGADAESPQGQSQDGGESSAEDSGAGSA